MSLVLWNLAALSSVVGLVVGAAVLIVVIRKRRRGRARPEESRRAD